MPGLEPSKDGVKQLFHMYRAAFPDLRMEVQDVLVSGDKAVARVRATGTHQGEFLGMPATGKSVDVQLIDITRFGDDGLAHEHWGVFDALAMMQQLGAIPQKSPDRSIGLAVTTEAGWRLRGEPDSARPRVIRHAPARVMHG